MVRILEAVRCITGQDQMDGQLSHPLLRGFSVSLYPLQDERCGISGMFSAFPMLETPDECCTKHLQRFAKRPNHSKATLDSSIGSAGGKGFGWSER